MKHKVFRLILRTLHKIAEIRQIGNPTNKAPVIVSEPDEKYNIFKLFQNTEVCIWKLNNVVCSGLYGGAIINNDNQVYSRFLSFPWGKELHPSLFSPYLGRLVMTIDKAIILITPAPSTNYYHWIADVLPRLLMIKKSQLKDFNERKIILHKKVRQYENDTFELLGIPLEKVVRISPFEMVKAGDVVLSDFIISYSDNPFPIWKKHLLLEFKDIVIDKTKSNKGKKIYCVRGKQRTRCLVGEEKLVAILIQQGFTILDPQKMALTDQVKHLAIAELVIALHGAALTNIIFCAEGAKIIELRSTHLPPEYFSEIAKTFNLQFETIQIPPVKKHNTQNLANEEDLILTDAVINKLMEKINNFK